EKNGLFGIRTYNHQYRRTYDFDGSTFTRRHQTGVSAWFIPQKYFRIFGGGSYVGKSGQAVDFFELNQPQVFEAVDYSQFTYNIGLRTNYRGGMFQAEYRAADYRDDTDNARDQKRSKIRLSALLPVPRYEWALLSGGFQHFETKYDKTDFKISANTVWGGTTVKLPENFTASYRFYFDRTGSDSDLVATDNLSHAIFAGHVWPGLAGLTVGYQHDINDDAMEAVEADGMYFSGWLKPLKNLDIGAEHGFRKEEVDEGARLLGDEDRNYFKISGKYRYADYGNFIARYENKNRRNDQLGSDIDFQRIALDASATLSGYGSIAAGYAYATGEYENSETTFEFADYLMHGDITSEEYHCITAGFGFSYYRSQKDLDVESYNLRFSGACRFLKTYKLEITYNVHNFDDFLVLDNYYTANIVEINLIKIVTF
ncbi:MAG: hypothetical protein ACOYVF_09815, partial [Candidatus Zixiibacteriota bacterium]